MADIASSPLVWAIIGGGLPTLLWVWYFNKQTEHRESLGVLLFSFLAGIIALWLTIPIQKYIIAQKFFFDGELIFALACIEEMVKFFVVRALVLRIHDIQYRSDYVLYMTTAALGFAAMENILYLIDPISVGDFSAAFMTGNLRFFGSTIVHSVSSALHGLWVGLALSFNTPTRWIYWIFGLASATLVHGVFNTYVGSDNSFHSIILFVSLWILLSIITILFHKSEIQFG